LQIKKQKLKPSCNHSPGTYWTDADFKYQVTIIWSALHNITSVTENAGRFEIRRVGIVQKVDSKYGVPCIILTERGRRGYNRGSCWCGGR